MIYLDNNATTVLDPIAAESMREVWRAGPLNPASQHAAGRRARHWCDEAIVGCGRLLGAACDLPHGPRLVLTSGGTEANNMAIAGWCQLRAGPLVLSAIEHSSIARLADQFAAGGRPVYRLPVHPQGVLQIESLHALLNQLSTAGTPPAVIAVMLANNETGVVQPVADVVRCAAAFEIPVHTDACQAVGKVPVDFAAVGAASLSFAAHKFHGPAGIGGLLLAPGKLLPPLLVGGDQQLGLRGGTEAVALAVGMHAALRQAVERMVEDCPQIERLRDQFEAILCQAIPAVEIHGASALRLPGTSQLSLPPADRQALLMALDLEGVCCSSGSACASGSSQPSTVLQAMGVGPAARNSALRFGFSRFSTDVEMRQAAERIVNVYNRLTQREAVDKSA